ncbi:hypothetical protein CAP35_06710 [Chitinophagaceae bacterium IBVUCB1]|nr:hypothetical protein CAP35_06710 [Chitinophagaceae bacterium IBVUCB1]
MSKTTAVNFDNSFYTIFCKEYNSQIASGKKYIEALNVTSLKMFSFENDAFKNWVQTEHAKDNKATDEVLTKEIVYLVLNKFIDNEFLQCGYEINKYEKQLSFFVKYICDCTDNKMKGFSNYEKGNKQAIVINACMKELVADSASIRILESGEPFSKSQELINCGGLYLFSKCSFFRNSLIDNEYAFFFSYRKRDVFEKRMNLNKEINNGILHGRVQYAKPLFIEDKVYSSTLEEWKKCSKELTRYKSNKHIKDISGSGDELITTWMINPGSKAIVLFQLSYSLKWVAGKPYITNTKYIPATFVKDKQVYIDRSTVIPSDEGIISSDAPPEMELLK